MSSHEDKRASQRVPLLLRIDYPGAPGFRDATENLSAGGLFIRTDRFVAVGARVPLLVSFPGLLDPLEIEVEVVWRRAPERDLPGGVAVKIPDDRPGDRSKLARLVEQSHEPAPAGRVYRILVVEDNAHVEQMYEQALRRLRSDNGTFELAIEYAHDGVDALARLERAPRIDLVLSDLYMPVMDGFALAERIRSDPAVMATPILAISAGGPDARERAVELGVDVYLEKPVRFAQILETVRALLRIKS